MDGRTPARRAPDFNILPRDAEMQAGADGLGRRFFGGKARGEALNGVLLRSTVIDLRGRVDAPQKAIAEARVCCLDALDFANINTRADNHLKKPVSTIQQPPTDDPRFFRKRVLL